MARRMGFFPSFFLRTLGVSERRPAWFVLFLSAMATAALYTLCFTVLALLGSRGGSTISSLAPAQIVLTVLFIWAEATLWYHLVYVVRYHWAGTDQTAGETRLEVWGSASVTLVLLFLKWLWFVFKYAVAPLLPLFLVIALQEIPGTGPMLRDATCVAFLLYPVACIVVYLVRHGWSFRKASLQNAGGRG